MYALVDCNNFYASCERLFRPNLRNKPVIILSNNDGCVIARSNEVKALGIPMGVPAYQIKDLIEKHEIAVFSSNYTLYGDMSNRVMSMLASFVEESYIYSIDEAFLNLSGLENRDLAIYGKDIVRKTSRGTGIPVSMGIAPTKTLAKLANRFAKKYPKYQSVCVIDTENKRIKALKLTEIGDIWGIGRQHQKMLESHGIKTAYDFTQQPVAWVRKKMTIVGERLWKELNGVSCITMELAPDPKKSICTSRSFGQMITELSDLKSAVSLYADLCAAKLRKQKSCAASLMVFIHTNNFREDLPQYFKNFVVNLPVATNSTLEINKYALEALQMIYAKGYQYKKAGVIITEIVPEDAIQGNIFDTVDRGKHKRLMNVVDKLNSGYKNRLISLAIQNGNRNWRLKQEQLSPCYTTNINDVITIKI